jgi:hypothetical protein
LVFEYIYSLTQRLEEASAASVYTSAVYSYLRSILTAGMTRSFFISLNSDTPRDLSWYYGIMMLWYYDVVVL